MSVTVIHGDCLATLATLPAGAAQCCVTSPPYYGLRDYGHAGQIGLEDTPDAYIARLVDVFRDVRRVLADDGCVFLNLGDSYASSPPGNTVKGVSARSGLNGVNGASGKYRETLAGGHATKRDTSKLAGYKPKDLLMIPAQVALALRADGWFLRSDIIWHKPNPMPESVTDRPTSAHEHVFLLTKRASYFYDAAAIAEEAQDWSVGGPGPGIRDTQHYGAGNGGNGGLAKRAAMYKAGAGPATRNARNVWTIATQPYSGAHFATMPPDLAERCIKAGSRPGDTILDPFGGAGTTGLVADRLGRSAILCELNPEYAGLARERIAADAGMFGAVA